MRLFCSNDRRNVAHGPSVLLIIMVLQLISGWLMVPEAPAENWPQPLAKDSGKMSFAGSVSLFSFLFIIQSLQSEAEVCSLP